MALEIRVVVDEERKAKLNEIDALVDANKTTVRLRLMNEAIDALHSKLCKPEQVLANMKGDTNE